MKKDQFKTEVKFLMEKPEGDINCDVFAFFPKERYNQQRDIYTCYAHIGQHGACHLDYANECKPAKKSEYMSLKRELENNYGYNLKVIQ